MAASLIVERDDKFDALDVPLTDELAGSAVSLQQAELRHYYYGKVYISVEQNANPILPLNTIQSSHVKSLASSMRAFSFGYRNRKISATWYGKCN